MKVKGKIITSLLLSFVLAGILLLATVIPAGESKGKLSEILLARPVFAQQAAASPSDEAGISAYVNVGQTIDLAKAKNVMRGIQAESDNYVIGIMKLPGLPEEEFPHMYVSSDGWILAYYSKFAPASRIFQYYGYVGGSISTTTLQDAISKICPTIGVNFAQVRGNMGYYHFKYPEATKMTIAVERIGEDATVARDTFDFSIPYDVTLYEGSWSHYIVNTNRSSVWMDDDSSAVSRDSLPGVRCGYFEDHQVEPGRIHRMTLYGVTGSGIAAVFIYR